MSKLIDLTNKKFNNLTVIRRSSSSRNGITTWECKCACGNQCFVSSDHLTRKSEPVKSCGCLSRLYGPNHKDWKGVGLISGQWWTRVARGANGEKGRAPMELTIDMEYAWRLFKKQKEKCALSGIEIYFPKHGFDKGTASLDRIDSLKGYVRGNVQWVHKDVNKMKNALDQEYFINMCSLITKTCLK
jgi:hypothetical protein